MCSMSNETEAEGLTLSLPRVINFKFPLQPHQIFIDLYITIYISTFRSNTQVKDDYTTILTTSLIHPSLKGFSETWEWNGSERQCGIRIKALSPNISIHRSCKTKLSGNPKGQNIEVNKWNWWRWSTTLGFTTCPISNEPFNRVSSHQYFSLVDASRPKFLGVILHAAHLLASEPTTDKLLFWHRCDLHNLFRREAAERPTASTVKLDHWRRGFVFQWSAGGSRDTVETPPWLGWDNWS